jgi:DNA excision repair protein ERCC-2
MRDALEREEITRPVLESVSQTHQVCPFELSLDLSLWADAVVCDYNYVFDPRVFLRRHFAEEPMDGAFLVDEAHNLVDRGREMFSAVISGRDIQTVKREIRQTLPRCARALGKVLTFLRSCGRAWHRRQSRQGTPRRGARTVRIPGCVHAGARGRNRRASRGA